MNPTDPALRRGNFFKGRQRRRCCAEERKNPRRKRARQQREALKKLAARKEERRSLRRPINHPRHYARYHTMMQKPPRFHFREDLATVGGKRREPCSGRPREEA